MNMVRILGITLALLVSLIGNASAQWASSVSPGENFFHTPGFQTPIDRLADYEWIHMQEQLSSGHPLGITIQNFEGGLTTNTAIGVIITDSPGAIGTNNGEVNAQANTGNRGGAAQGSTEQQQSLTVAQPVQKPQSCQKECK